MKILYHHRTQMDDAQGIHITEIVNSFRKLGHDVRVFSLVHRDENSGEKQKGKSWELITSIVPNFIYEFMEITYNLYAYFRLILLIRSFKPDFLYERYAMYNFCGILAAKTFNIPIILEVNAPLYLEQLHYEKLTFKMLSRSVENWICNNATRVVVVTSTLRDILINQGVNHEKLIVITNGVNPDEFNKNKKFQSVRSRYGISSEAIVAGVVGWFREWHGLDFLIKVCKENHLFSKYNLYLFFIGDGPVVEENKRLVETENLGEFVKFTGPIDRKNIPDYIAALDIAIQPRVTDYASPMKILEYMAMAKAIIAPDKQNIQDILQDNENALLFEPENKINLFKRLELLIWDKELRDKISENACNTIINKKLYWLENAKQVIKYVNQTKYNNFPA